MPTSSQTTNLRLMCLLLAGLVLAGISGGLCRAATAPATPAPTGNLSDQLLAYLPFNHDLQDASPAKLPVKTVGDIEVENGSAYFMGGKSWLELPNLPFNQPFAISVWIKTDNHYDMLGLLEQTQSKKQNEHFHIMLRNSLQPYLGFYRNDVIAPRGINAAEWTHLVFQFTGTHQEIWVDGRLLVSRLAAPYAGSQGATYIGRNPGWRNVPAKNFAGRMSELRIYGRALSAEEMAMLNTIPAGVRTDLQPGENFPPADVARLNLARLTGSPAVITDPARPFLALEGNRLTITGVAGEIYLLEATTNLASPWMSLVTLTNSTGQVSFTDDAAGLFSQRFYRVEVTSPP